MPAMRHRLILNFEAEAEGITTDQVIGQILKDVPATRQWRRNRDRRMKDGTKTISLLKRDGNYIAVREVGA